MEQTMLCPKCGSNEIEARDHEQNLKKVGGVLLSSAGATAGTVGGAATGASVGAAIGAVVGGPLGVIFGGTVGTFIGAIGIGVTGGVVGNILGKKAGITVDKNLFQDYRCLKCQTRFNAPIENTSSVSDVEESTVNNEQDSSK